MVARRKAAVVAKKPPKVVLASAKNPKRKSKRTPAPRPPAVPIKEEPESPPRRRPRSPAVKKTGIAKKVVFSPETKFKDLPPVATATSRTAANPVLVGAEALCVVVAGLAAWFYPLFTANLATNGR